MKTKSLALLALVALTSCHQNEEIRSPARGIFEMLRRDSEKDWVNSIVLNNEGKQYRIIASKTKKRELLIVCAGRPYEIIQIFEDSEADGKLDKYYIGAPKKLISTHNEIKSADYTFNDVKIQEFNQERYRDCLNGIVKIIEDSKSDD